MKRKNKPKRKIDTLVESSKKVVKMRKEFHNFKNKLENNKINLDRSTSVEFDMVKSNIVVEVSNVFQLNTISLNIKSAERLYKYLEDLFTEIE